MSAEVTRVIPPPISSDKVALLARLIVELEAPALHWLSGYLAGVAAQRQSEPLAPVLLPNSSAPSRLSIIYGTQTGNAKRAAEQLAQRAESAGLAVRLLRADAYPTGDLKHERLLYVVISTHSSEDKVEPPDDARGFFEFLCGRRAPPLPGLKYAVLALGDSSYPDFCGIGRQLDERLAELGATRVQARAEADVDIETVAVPWLGEALDKAREHLRKSEGSPVSLATVTPLRPRVPTWSRENPFAAEVVLNQPIIARGGRKDVRHIEVSLDRSGLRHEPGDALGVWPTQASTLVAAVLDTLKLDGDQPIEHHGEWLPLRRWLAERRELTMLTQTFLAAHAERGNHAEVRALLAPAARQNLIRLLATQQLLDVLRQYPSDWDAEALVAALCPLVPRLYSIASSRAFAEDEVHLTVAHITWRREGGMRWGVASHYLAEATEGTRVPIFIETNERFRLPSDPDRDVIMIGPGTGVAPFRAFVQERQAIGAGGHNWLFFGNPHRRTDFLYQLEWHAALRSGALRRLDVAFSRDQQNKIYVQHRLHE